MSDLLIFLGLVSFVVGIVALIRPIRRLRIDNRRIAAVVLAGGFVVMMIGAAIAGPPDDQPEAATSTTSAGSTASAPATTALTIPTTTAAPTTTAPPTTSPASAATTTSATGVGADAELTTVERIIDGDTFVVSGDVRIRLIGVDTPEVDDDECYADQATAFLTSLIPVGSQVLLSYDVERLDRFGRTLAYVYRAEDDLFVNAELMAEGYAQVLTIPPNVAFADEFVALQQNAREANLGLWSACQTTNTQAPVTTAPSSTTTGGGNCDPAYPDVCIPPPPPDLDCGEISFRDFTVLEPDPHRFDGDNDGIGCES